MSEPSASAPRQHRWTSLARPLDPAWPTNRAVLALMPLGAVLAAGRAWMLPASDQPGPTWMAALGAAVVLGAWAAGRELAPDDQRAAFLALVLGLGSLLVYPDASVLVLFTTLALARMVSRTVGPPPKVTDSAALVGLIGLCMARTGAVGTAVVGALAFALDARLTGGLRRQWGFSALSLALAGALALAGLRAQTDGPADPAGGAGGGAAWLGLPLGIAVLFASAVMRTHDVQAPADVGGAPLSARRVRAAMSVALLMALQLLALRAEGARLAALLWAVLAGVGLSSLGWRSARPAHQPTSPL